MHLPKLARLLAANEQHRLAAWVIIALPACGKRDLFHAQPFTQGLHRALKGVEILALAVEAQAQHLPLIRDALGVFRGLVNVRQLEEAAAADLAVGVSGQHREHGPPQACCAQAVVVAEGVDQPDAVAQRMICRQPQFVEGRRACEGIGDRLV